jgi:transcriptional regulator with XRE-family HTH domain
MKIGISFTQWLQAEMDKRGWSQVDLARTAHVNREVVCKLMNGSSGPQPTTLERIARALAIPVE